MLEAAICLNFLERIKNMSKIQKAVSEIKSIEELANEANGAYKVGKVNVDEAPELAARYRIAGIPAIVVFKNGEVYKKSIGVVPKADLEELLK